MVLKRKTKNYRVIKNKYNNMQNKGQEIIISEDLRARFFYQIALLRFFENSVLDLFSEGKLSGTCHCYVGQEAVAVSVINNLSKNDIIVSNHRCHGHYLARTEDVEGLLAELMGKKIGLCGGWGGSQHLYKGNFFTNGILGSTVPIAAGMAYAEKKRDSGAITVLFMGDGAFGEGIVYETLNMISLWKIPILIVVENNFYAQSTPLRLNCAGNLLDRVKSFGLQAGEIQSNDVEELYCLFNDKIRIIREQKTPYVQIVNTYRFCPHSKGDDCRPLAELEYWKQRDPFLIIGKRVSDAVKANLKDKAERKVNDAISSLI